MEIKSFGDLLNNGIKKQKAKIIFAGDEYDVQLVSRRVTKIGNLIRFKVIGENHGYDGRYLTFNTNSPDNTELVNNNNYE